MYQPPIKYADSYDILQSDIPASEDLKEVICEVPHFFDD